MTTKLIFETDQDDEIIRSLIISAARLGIYFKSCRNNNIEQLTEPYKYSMSYRLDMNKELEK